MYKIEKWGKNQDDSQLTSFFKIKFRDQSALIARLEPEIRELEAKLSSISLSTPDRITATERHKSLRQQYKDLYHNIAIEFAELHDMPGTLKI